jgi:hypothetical protein
MVRQPGLLIQDRFQTHHPGPMLGGQTRDGDLDPHKFCHWWTKYIVKPSLSVRLNYFTMILLAKALV